jgi:tRNA modification GTPase
MKLFDTIAAISTPYGKGGVAMLRVSGENAVEIAARVFQLKNNKSLTDVAPRTAVYGTILAPEGEKWLPVDDGIATVFRAPASFTGEDTVEICCHGGILVTQTVLEALLCAGARAAEAGEFTRRAHLNGKLSLSSAEALGSLLEAGNRAQMTLAYGGLGGRLAGEIGGCYEQLLRLMSSVLACIDFPDEDLAEMSREDMTASATEVLRRVRSLLATYRTGHAVAEGIPTVICGRTNVGKSSLYNQLLGRDAAIVTDIEGTTRDVLSEVVSLGGVTLRLYDTAGLRETQDAVERIGIDRARAAMDEAELILALFDLTRPLTDDERVLLDALKARAASGTVVVALLNKADALSDTGVADGVASEVGKALENVLSVSAQSGQGLDALTGLVNARFVDGALDLRSDAIVANARQHAALSRAADALERSLEVLAGELPIDVCCVDLTEAMCALSELDGREVNEDIVDEIFKHFCVGK